MCPCLSLGRFWLVIKEDGHMVTARQEPRLVLVSITYEDDCLVFQAPDMGRLALPCKLPSSNKIHDCRYSAWAWGPAPGLVSCGLLPARCPATVCTVGDEAGRRDGLGSSRWSGVSTWCRGLL